MLWGGGLPTRPLEASDASWPWVFPDHHPNQPLTFIEPTSWEIKRPLPRPQGRVIPLQEIDVILVPGVAFDPQKGARLGLGGGHYDRTLSKGAERSWSGLAFGVGFALQVSRTLPIESWDVPLDGLFTEFGFARPEHRQDHSIERRGRETKR